MMQKKPAWKSPDSGSLADKPRILLLALCFMAMFCPAYAQKAAMPAEKRFSLDALPDTAWRVPLAENLLYLEIDSGRIVIETARELAPLHVARMEKLAEEAFFDGIVFHRVIEGFMAQGGDPTGTGAGGSPMANLAAEFSKPLGRIVPWQELGRDNTAARVGFNRTLPIGAKKPVPGGEAGNVSAWGMHCPGVVSMARTADPDSANSQFFIMFRDARLPLDQNYTVWGRVVHGAELLASIARGEPPETPTSIKSLRRASSIAIGERVKFKILRTDTPHFLAYLRSRKWISSSGFIESVCSIAVPTMAL